MNYIGIDLGTSAVKLLLMQGDGSILKVVNREYPISFPKPGWSQQEPEDWYRETMAGIKELLWVRHTRFGRNPRKAAQGILLALAGRCMVW